MKICIVKHEVKPIFVIILRYIIFFIDVSLTNMLFEGGKADLAKGLSSNFQVAHSFTLGTGMQPSSYNFASIFASGKVKLNNCMNEMIYMVVCSTCAMEWSIRPVISKESITTQLLTDSQPNFKPW